MIEKRVPTAELPASPRRGPTLLAQVMDHLEDVEVAWNRKVQHAEHEARDGEREVSVDRELLRHRADQYFRNPPRATQRAEPHHDDEETDREKRLAHLIGFDVFHCVNALQEIEQQPVNRRE